MLRETDSLSVHAARLALVSFQDARLPCMLEGKNGGKGAAGDMGQLDASLGRQHEEVGALLRENGKLARKDRSGIELAEEIVRIVNVQHNFDANAKVVSTIDAMYDSLLNFRV